MATAGIWRLMKENNFEGFIRFNNFTLQPLFLFFHIIFIRVQGIETYRSPIKSIVNLISGKSEIIKIGCYAFRIVVIMSSGTWKKTVNTILESLPVAF